MSFENNVIDVIYNDSLDPYFNLASEEYLIYSDSIKPIFMLWRNNNTVVIGKNQNTYSEVNYSYVDKNNISVVRRLSGGGAVFHDLGNVNFTYIVPENSENCKIDFSQFIRPIQESLKKLNVDSVLSGRNDIEINGYKVSGNAQAHINSKILHHGTLLWDSDMTFLSGSLNVDNSKLESKGIKSIKSRVRNIKNICNSNMSTEEFISFIFDSLGYVPRQFSDREKASINVLREEKYSTWEWNWGKSKEFSFSKKHKFEFGLVEVKYNSENGTIKEVSIDGDFFGYGDIGVLCDRLKGVKLNADNLICNLRDVGDFIFGANPDEITELFFN